MTEQEPTINVRKISYMVPVSFELLIGEGAMTEDEAIARGWVRPEPARVSRWRRIRFDLEWRWAKHRPHAHIGPCDHSDCA